MKLKTERDLSYTDPLTVEFFQNNRTSSICVILLTNGRADGRTDSDFNTSLAEVKMILVIGLEACSAVLRIRNDTES